MSTSVWIHFAGAGLVLLLSRLGGGPTDVLFQAQALGWLLVVAAFAMSLRNSDREGGAGAARGAGRRRSCGRGPALGLAPPSSPLFAVCHEFFRLVRPIGALL